MQATNFPFRGIANSNLQFEWKKRSRTGNDRYDEAGIGNSAGLRVRGTVRRGSDVYLTMHACDIR